MLEDIDGREDGGLIMLVMLVMMEMIVEVNDGRDDKG